MISCLFCTTSVHLKEILPHLTKQDTWTPAVSSYPNHNSSCYVKKQTILQPATFLVLNTIIKKKSWTIWTIQNFSAVDFSMSLLFPATTEMYKFIHNNVLSHILLPPSAVLHMYYHFNLQSLKKKKAIVFWQIIWVDPRPLITMSVKTNREIERAPFNLPLQFSEFPEVCASSPSNQCTPSQFLSL